MEIIIKVLFIFNCFVFAQNFKKVFVFEHVRHGARGPWQALNDHFEDIFGEKWSGMGELTSVGQRMHFLLGVRNRKKYLSFLNPNYDPNEMLIYSTNVNRTIISIGSQMQGLYPISSGPTLSTNQIKKAVPPNQITVKMQEEMDKLGINVLPHKMDLLPVHLFNPYERSFSLNDNVNCPALVKIKEENVNSKEMKKMAQEEQQKFNATFGEQLFRYFNIKDPNYYFNMDKLYDFADIFISTYTDGRKMEKFKETKIDFEALYNEALYISFLVTHHFEFTSKNNIVSIMSMSPTYRKIVNWMDQRYQLEKEGKGNIAISSAPKMVIYSGHDTTLGTNYFSWKEMFDIPIQETAFTSSLYIELVKKQENGYYVQLYSNDQLMKEIPFLEFKTKVMETIWTSDEIERFCYGIKSDQILMIISLVLGGLSVFLAGALGIIVYKQKKDKNAF